MRPFRSLNVFNLSHERKLSCNMGELIPIMCEEVVPGDRFRVSTDMVVKMAPLLAPIMHNIDVYTHYFFVPNRLLFEDWEDFITGGPEGNDTTVAPTISAPAGGFSVGSLADYFGLPTGIENLSVSAMPFRAYALIYNQYYRDENLQEEVDLSLGAGVDDTTSTALLNRCWAHDNFTSALPFQQRGPAVNLPLGQVAPVQLYNRDNGTAGAITGNALLAQQANNIGGISSVSDPENFNGAAAGTFNIPPAGERYWVGADLSNATAATINDIRRAFQVQRWLEKNARAGVRYIESILAHFGVKSSDARMQRAEYLGGGRSPMVISEVLQTSADDGQPTPLATMAGHGVSAQRSHQFKRFFEEHGFVIGLLSVMPKPTYQQGVSRMWTRGSRYDYYWPVFSHLGEQAILNREVYAQGNDDDSGVFGYQPRYEEYRRRNSSVHGDFRTNLSFWHLGRIFNSAPGLNSEFVTCNPSTRVFAVEDAGTDHLWIDLYNHIKAVRPIPKRGQPGYIDHE